jgi:hypothetical protein
MTIAPSGGRLETAHTLFAAAFSSARGLRLSEVPFDQYLSMLTDPENYRETQRLGSRVSRCLSMVLREIRMGGVMSPCLTPGYWLDLRLYGRASGSAIRAKMG